MLFDAAGDLYVAGTNDAQCGDFMVAKLDSNGRLVQAFATEGIGTYDVGGGDAATDLAMDGEGRLYVGGYSRFQCRADRPNFIIPFAVIRLHT